VALLAAPGPRARMLDELTRSVQLAAAMPAATGDPAADLRELIDRGLAHLEAGGRP